MRVRGSGGRLLPVRSQAGRVSSSSADHRVSSSPVRSGAAAERGILEGCPASRCPLGAGRGWPAPPLRQFWGQEQKETSMTIMLFLFVKITFWQTRLSLFLLSSSRHRGGGHVLFYLRILVVRRVLGGRWSQRTLWLLTKYFVDCWSCALPVMLLDNLEERYVKSECPQ